MHFLPFLQLFPLLRFKPLPEEASAYMLIVVFFVFAVTSLVWGFAGKRPKTHYLRVRARAARRALLVAAQGSSKPLVRVSARPWLARILVAAGAKRARSIRA